jgi:hypothetical protein
MRDIVFDDAKKSRYKLSKQNLLELEEQEQSMKRSVSSLNLSGIPQDRPVLPPIPKETEVIFIHDGSRYYPMDPSKMNDMQYRYGSAPLETFTFVERFTRFRTEFFFLTEVLYAGACFLGLLFLPTSPFEPLQYIPVANTTMYPYTFQKPQQVQRNMTDSNFAMFSFLLYYSTRAASTSYAFQLLSTINTCSCLAKLMDQIELYNSNVQVSWPMLKRTLFAIIGSICRLI